MSKISNVTKKTLDTQHVNKLLEFQEKDNIISKLQKEIEIINNNIQKLKSHELTDAEFEEYMLLQDKLTETKKNLENYQRETDEVEYYIDTASILFQYYDILENGKDINTIPKASTSGNSILKYFVPPNDTKAKPSESNIDRASLLEKYMNVTDSNYIKNMDHDMKDKCPHCLSLDRNIMLNDGLIYCNTCFTVEYMIVDHERPSYRDPPKEMANLKIRSDGRFLKVHSQKNVLVAYAA
jgi:hypothetical protein